MACPSTAAIMIASTWQAIINGVTGSAPMAASNPSAASALSHLPPKRGGSEDPRIAIGRVRVRRRQIRKALRRSHGRLVDTVADARAVVRADDERVQGVDRVVVERPTAARGVRTALQQRALDLEIAILGVRIRDIHDQEVGE